MTSVSDPGTAGTALRPAVDVPLDSHLHTDLSTDSRVPIDVYARLAAERGITELAITDHLDFDPGAPNFAFTDYDTRLRTVRGAAERWAERVAIRFGVEITYESRREADIAEYLTTHPYDFTIGSVHVHSGSPWHPLAIETSLEAGRLADAVRPYFEEVAAAARSGLFDTIGHLDYVKKYIARRVPPAAFAALTDEYDLALRPIADGGLGLEVNTSGLRHATGETYPPAWAVARFRELGGTRVTAGSDAHATDHFGFALEHAYRFAADAGFEALAFRRGEEPVVVPIPARFLAAADS